MSGIITDRTININIFAGSATKKTMNIDSTMTYYDILKKLDINPEIVIVMVRGLPQPLDETPDCDTIDILRVVSGG